MTIVSLENSDWFIAKSILAQGRKYDTMRKQQKKQVSEQLSTLYEACCELPKHSGQTFIDLCAEIQEFVSGIFNFVESTAGEGTVTADLLGQLYEMLFKATQYEATTEQLIDLVKKIDESLYDLKIDKIEIAFFCYKASMSDCLSSIYFAAKEDQHCDAYFIPIPYFDRKGDGSIGEMHLEAEGCYSDKFDLTDWRTYNIEEHLPDVVFFMAPYDQHNFVTSVHPDFYSKRLKQYCGLLCLSPYFVSNENADFVKSGGETLCATTGALNADYIFVQSEKVKKAWINAINKVEYENNSKGAFGDLENKIRALGSPKFDAVLDTRNEFYPRVEEWVKLINGRKVVFYNTTVSGILRGGEQYVKKIHSVIETFKNQNDVVLLWRPHPLMEQTFNSVRPELAAEWREIVAEYKHEADVFNNEKLEIKSNFIFDDTSFFHQAMAMSDIYFGDISSSLVTLYQATGKPIMIQNIGDTTLPIAAESIYADEKSFWFAAYHYNSLFRVNRETWKVEWLGTFSDEDFYKNRLYPSVAECNGKLYFAPLSAKEIAEYDLQKKIFRKINFDLSDDSIHAAYDAAKFIRVVSINQYVFFIPYFHPAILIYNTETDLLTACTDWVDLIERKRTNKDIGYFIDYEIHGTKLVLPCACASIVLVFDSETHTTEAYEMPGNKTGIQLTSVCTNGETFYFTMADGTILIRELLSQTEEIKKIDKLPIDHGNIAFYPIKYYDNKVWIFPLFAEKALILDIKTDTVSVLEELSDEIKYDSGNQLILFATLINDCFYIMTGRSYQFLEYNPKTNEKHEKVLTISKEDENKIRKLASKELLQRMESREADDRIYEDGVFSLPVVLDCIHNTDSYKINKQITVANTNAGESIYYYVKKLVLP